MVKNIIYNPSTAECQLIILNHSLVMIGCLVVLNKSDIRSSSAAVLSGLLIPVWLRKPDVMIQQWHRHQAVVWIMVGRAPSKSCMECTNGTFLLHLTIEQQRARIIPSKY